MRTITITDDEAMLLGALLAVLSTLPLNTETIASLQTILRDDPGTEIHAGMTYNEAVSTMARQIVLRDPTRIIQNIKDLRSWSPGPLHPSRSVLGLKEAKDAIDAAYAKLRQEGRIV